MRILAEAIREEGLSKHLLTTIRRQVSKVYHPDLAGGDVKVMQKYNGLLDDLNKFVQ